MIEKRMKWLLRIAGVSLPAWLIIMVLGACTPTAAAPAETGPYSFYLAPAPFISETDLLSPLDPDTLAAAAGGVPHWLFSADGTTGIDTAHPAGRASRDPQDHWIIVHDLRVGGDPIRFHPLVPGPVTAVSADGARLLLQVDANPNAQNTYPPTVDWYVLDSGDGTVLAHIRDGKNACFRQQVIFDPAGERIYCATAPDFGGRTGLEALQISAYDVRDGERTAVLTLPEVLIGGARDEEAGGLAEAILEPALALSPDGTWLAVVHAESARITLVETATMTVERSFSYAESTGWWEQFGLAAQQAHAKGELTGAIRQAVFGPDGDALYVFSQELWVKSENGPETRGLQRVDLAGGKLVAAALPDYQIQWVKPAPDGTLYVFGTSDARLLPFEIRDSSPSLLWRLDGATLAVLAARELTGYRAGALLPGEQVTIAAEGSAAEVPDSCPVTLPPAEPFVPPAPWPQRPPSADRFWYGGDALWTALPVDGRWAQLARGEKFWWWSEKFDVAEDSTPDLIITATRTDSAAPPLQVSRATNGYHESFHWAMLAGVELSTSGCWEFTGSYKGETLSFILWVPQRY